MASPHLTRVRYWDSATTFTYGFLGGSPIVNLGWVIAIQNCSIVHCLTHLHSVSHTAHISTHEQELHMVNCTVCVIFLLPIRSVCICISFTNTATHNYRLRACISIAITWREETSNISNHKYITNISRFRNYVHKLLLHCIKHTL